MIAAAAGTGGRAHIVHLSAAECVAMIAAAKAAGIQLTAETCPHYLYFAAEQVPDGATEFKCCPPIRDSINREALWRGLEGGVIDCVVSDHSPCPPELKAAGHGDFGAAWGGIASLQLGLPAVWTAARRRGRTLDDVVRWMAAAPAALAGLTAKGRLAAGCDADLVAFDPDAVLRGRPDPPAAPAPGDAVRGPGRCTVGCGRRGCAAPRCSTRPAARRKASPRGDCLTGAEREEPVHGRTAAPRPAPAARLGRGGQ